MGILAFDTVTTASLIIGAIVLMIYSITFFRKKRDIPEIGKALSILLPVIAIPQGIYVCSLALNESIVSCIGISPTFLFVGGVTIMWVSIDKIIKTFREIENNAPPP